MWWIIPYFLSLWGISWLSPTALSGTGMLRFSRHGGSGRFEPADILCGHSSGGGGQHHESLHSFTLANEVPAYREQGIFRGCRGGAGLVFSERQG